MSFESEVAYLAAIKDAQEGTTATVGYVNLFWYEENHGLNE